MHKDGKEDTPGWKDQISPVPAVRKHQERCVLRTTKWHSQRVPGTQAFPESSWAHSRQSRSPQAGEASQKQGTAARSWDSTVQGWGQETAKRNREQKHCPWWKESMFWMENSKCRIVTAAELRERAVKHWNRLSRETAESPPLEIFRTWWSPEWPDLRSCFKRRLAQVRSHPTWTFLSYCHYACHFRDRTRDLQDLRSQFCSVLKCLCIFNHVLPSQVILADFNCNICFGVFLVWESHR